MVSSLTVGIVQMAMSEHKAENLEKALALTTQAASQGAGLVCLPELFASRYFCQVEDERFFDLAEPLNGPLVERCQALSKRLSISLLVPVFERRAAGVYHNSCVVLDNGDVVGKYRKMHIPDDPQYYEKYYFTPGDLGFVAYSTRAAVVGPLICWDQWYPEAARLTALKGAQVLAYPTAIGFLPSEKAENGAAQVDAWQTVQRSHAIANGVFVIAANRVGFEQLGQTGIEFWGRSFVCDPFGRIIAEAGSEEQVLLAQCDLSLSEKTRQTWPFLRDRRIDAYQGITKRLLDD